MRLGLVAIVGLMAGVGVACAQQASEPGTPLTMTHPPKMKAAATPVQLQSRYPAWGVGCPGQLVARQQATGGATVWTTAYEDQGDKADWIARPRGLGIHVEFTGDGAAVKDLELRVSYLPMGLRSMQVAPQMTNGVAESPRERAKTFNLNREAALRIGGDLLVGPAATITRVQLVSATFADGNVWHASSENQCSIEPSKYMLVEAKK